MNELAQALKDLDEAKVKELVKKMIADGVPPLDIIADCNEGMTGVGELFAAKTYYISQLMYSAQILKDVMVLLEPLLESISDEGGKEQVIIGTVKGDIHDIGKNIVATLLRGSGFKVIDLGVDVPAQKFVEAIKANKAKALGMSALLNSTYPEMKKVIDAINAAGLREQVKIVIGGAPINEQVREFSGADFAAKDAVDGVNICKQIYA